MVLIAVLLYIRNSCLRTENRIGLVVLWLSGLKSWVVLLLSGLKSWVVLLLSGLKSWVVLLLSGLKNWVVLLLSGLKSWVVLLLSGLKIWVVLLLSGLKSWLLVQNQSCDNKTWHIIWICELAAREWFVLSVCRYKLTFLNYTSTKMWYKTCAVTSSMKCGTWVLFPLPVSPAISITLCFLSACTISALYL